MRQYHHRLDRSKGRPVGCPPGCGNELLHCPRSSSARCADAAGAHHGPLEGAARSTTAGAGATIAGMGGEGRRGVVLVVCGLLLASVGCGDDDGGSETTGSSAATTTTTTTTTVALPEIQDIEEAGALVIDTTGNADWVTLAGDSAWVANLGRGISRYDLATGDMLGEIETNDDLPRHGRGLRLAVGRRLRRQHALANRRGHGGAGGDHRPPLRQHPR